MIRRGNNIRWSHFIRLRRIDHGTFSCFIIRNQIHIIILKSIEVTNIHRATAKLVDEGWKSENEERNSNISHLCSLTEKVVWALVDHSTLTSTETAVERTWKGQISLSTITLWRLCVRKWIRIRTSKPHGLRVRAPTFFQKRNHKTSLNKKTNQWTIEQLMSLHDTTVSSATMFSHHQLTCRRNHHVSLYYSSEWSSMLAKD